MRKAGTALSSTSVKAMDYDLTICMSQAEGAEQQCEAVRDEPFTDPDKQCSLSLAGGVLLHSKRVTNSIVRQKSMYL
jgi:hypothetical protein